MSVLQKSISVCLTLRCYSTGNDIRATAFTDEVAVMFGCDPPPSHPAGLPLAVTCSFRHMLLGGGGFCRQKRIRFINPNVITLRNTIRVCQSTLALYFQISPYWMLIAFCLLLLSQIKPSDVLDWWSIPNVLYNLYSRCYLYVCVCMCVHIVRSESRCALIIGVGSYVQRGLIQFYVP
jgi:hypothetical protein